MKIVSMFVIGLLCLMYVPQPVLSYEFPLTSGELTVVFDDIGVGGFSVGALEYDDSLVLFNSTFNFSPYTSGVEYVSYSVSSNGENWSLGEFGVVAQSFNNVWYRYRVFSFNDSVYALSCGIIFGSGNTVVSILTGDTISNVSDDTYIIGTFVGQIVPLDVVLVGSTFYFFYVDNLFYVHYATSSVDSFLVDWDFSVDNTVLSDSFGKYEGNGTLGFNVVKQGFYWYFYVHKINIHSNLLPYGNNTIELYKSLYIIPTEYDWIETVFVGESYDDTDMIGYSMCVYVDDVCKVDRSLSDDSVFLYLTYVNTSSLAVSNVFLEGEIPLSVIEVFLRDLMGLLPLIVFIMFFIAISSLAVYNRYGGD